MVLSLEDLQTPCLLVDLDVVRRNLQRTLAIVGSPDRWRPHIKTSKIPAVFEVLLQSPVRQFKCATTKEAATLLELAERHKPIDLLVAMPHYGANLRRVAELAERFPRHTVAVLTEDPGHAAEVRSSYPHLGLFVDLDPGYHRTGIPLTQFERIEATVRAGGDKVAGLHFYDGHLHGGTRAEREAECHRIYADFLATVDRLELASDIELITSGTPTFPIAAAYEPFAQRRHRVSPGTVVYWDLISQGLEIEGYDYAVTVLSRVISHPGGDRITLDAGTKALDAAAGVPCCALRDYPELQPQRTSEEHLPVAIGSSNGQVPAIGSLQRLIPKHVCPTVNLADEAVLLEGGAIQGIVAVTARGHETA